MKRFLKQGITVILILLFITVNLFATTVDELENKKDDIKDNIKQGEQEIKEKEASIEELKESLADINNQLQETSLIIEGYEEKLLLKKEEIDATQAKLDQAILDEEKYRAQAIERIKVMYEYGDSAYIDILIESKNINDFLTRLEYLNQILKYDNEMFENLAKLQLEIETAKEKLVLEAENLEHLKAEADLHKGSLEALVAKQAGLMKTIENDKYLLQKQIEDWKKAEEEIDRLIIKKIKESNLKYTGGKFNWPIDGYYNISSYFGTRPHPIFGYTESHSGLDIPAPYGTNIEAAANGVVITSRWSSSYGNLIIIDHGSGYATLYAHSSKRLVNEGDTVVRGQVIANVGSTGWSTGNHLHFGVQLDGKWVDPLNYVSQ